MRLTGNLLYRHVVYVHSLPGCISEGDTKEMALSNIKEAIELYLDPVEDDFNQLNLCMHYETSGVDVKREYRTLGVEENASL